MPQVLTAVGALVKTFSLKATLWSVAKFVATNFLLGKLSSALAGKSKVGSGITPQTVTIRDTLAARAIVYGEVRTGGSILFFGTSGSTSQYLWYVVAIAGHQCQSVTDVWLDNEKIDNSLINGTTGEISSGRFAGYVNIWKFLGTSTQTVQADLDAAFTEWTSAHELTGVCYAVIRLRASNDVWPNGAPQNFFFLTRGRLVYDPRLDTTNGGSGSHRLTDATTWAWSANPALCAANYLTGGSLYNDTATSDPRMGLRVPSTRIDWTTLAASANECEETPAIPGPSTQTRYVLGAVFTADQPHEEILQTICESMAGPIPIYWGGKYRIYAGRYDTPTITFTDDDLTEEGYEIIGGTEWTQRYNAVIAEYMDPARDWQFTTCPMQTDSGYETEDGRRVVRTIQLDGVTNDYRAQRISNVRKLQSRNQVVAKLHFGLNGLKITPWETFNLTLTEESWSSKVFRALDIEIDFGQRQVSVTAREESSAAWADLGSFGTSVTGGTTPIFERPAPPENFSIVPSQDGILFTWDWPTNLVPPYVVELWEYTSDTPFSSATRVFRGTTTGAFLPKSDTTTRYYWLRAQGAAAQYSDTNPASNGQPGAANAITAGFRATASPTSALRVTTASSGTTPTVTITPVNGVPTYSYSWAYQSGDSSTTISSSTSSTPTFTRTGMAVDTTYASVWRCTVTDSTGGTPLTTTVDVAVSITRVSTE